MKKLFSAFSVLFLLALFWGPMAYAAGEADVKRDCQDVLKNQGNISKAEALRAIAVEAKEDAVCANFKHPPLSEKEEKDKLDFLTNRYKEIMVNKWMQHAFDMTVLRARMNVENIRPAEKSKGEFKGLCRGDVILQYAKDHGNACGKDGELIQGYLKKILGGKDFDQTMKEEYETLSDIKKGHKIESCDGEVCTLLYVPTIKVEEEKSFELLKEILNDKKNDEDMLKKKIALLMKSNSFIRIFFLDNINASTIAKARKVVQKGGLDQWANFFRQESPNLYLNECENAKKNLVRLCGQLQKNSEQMSLPEMGLKLLIQHQIKRDVADVSKRGDVARDWWRFICQEKTKEWTDQWNPNQEKDDANILYNKYFFQYGRALDDDRYGLDDLHQEMEKFFGLSATDKGREQRLRELQKNNGDVSKLKMDIGEMKKKLDQSVASGMAEASLGPAAMGQREMMGLEGLSPFGRIDGVNYGEIQRMQAQTQAQTPFQAPAQSQMGGGIPASSGRSPVLPPPTSPAPFFPNMPSEASSSLAAPAAAPVSAGISSSTTSSVIPSTATAIPASSAISATERKLAKAEQDLERFVDNQGNIAVDPQAQKKQKQLTEKIRQLQEELAKERQGMSEKKKVVSAPTASSASSAVSTTTTTTTSSSSLGGGDGGSSSGSAASAASGGEYIYVASAPAGESLKTVELIEEKFKFFLDQCKTGKASEQRLCLYNLVKSGIAKQDGEEKGLDEVVEIKVGEKKLLFKRVWDPKLARYTDVNQIIIDINMGHEKEKKKDWPEQVSVQKKRRWSVEGLRKSLVENTIP